MKQKFLKMFCIAMSAFTIATAASNFQVFAAENMDGVSWSAEMLSTGTDAKTITIKPWEASTNYVKGDVVSYKGGYYECLQPHQALGGWEPDTTPALWTVYTGEIPTPDPDPTPGPDDVAVTAVTLDKTSLKLETGKSDTLTAAVLPDNATNKNVTWKTSDSKIATVTNGVVLAVSAGTTVITAAAGSKEAACTVTVSEPAPAPMPDDSPLPGRVLTGYWQNFDNGAPCLKLADVPKEYNIICISFAEATTTAGEITFQLDKQLSTVLGGYTVSDFKQDVTTAHNKGQKVVLSIGGELGNVTINSPASAKAFADSAYALMQEYGFDGIDIDLEHGIDVPNLSNSLHTLAAKAGPGFILTMAPQTMDIYTYDATYLKLGRECSDILTIMNAQYYNSGGMPGYGGAVYNQGTVGFVTSLATTQLESGLRPDQVGLGLPAVTRAAGGGYQDPSNVAAAIESLVYGTTADGFTPPRAYNNLRGAMTWSINWDASNGYKFAKTVSDCFAKLPPIITGK